MVNERRSLRAPDEADAASARGYEARSEKGPRETAAPLRPTPGSRRLVAFLAALILAGAAGTTGWLLRDWIDRQPRVWIAANYADLSIARPVLLLNSPQKWYRSFAPEVVGAPRSEAPPPGSAMVSIYLVRLANGEVKAWHAASPWQGCRVVFTTSVRGGTKGSFTGTDQPGFGDPCSGSFFALDGRHLAGAGHRGLNGFATSVSTKGEVMVDLTRPIYGA